MSKGGSNSNATSTTTQTPAQILQLAQQFLGPNGLYNGGTLPTTNSTFYRPPTLMNLIRDPNDPTHSKIVYGGTGSSVPPGTGGAPPATSGGGSNPSAGGSQPPQGSLLNQLLNAVGGGTFGSSSSGSGATGSPFSGSMFGFGGSAAPNFGGAGQGGNYNVGSGGGTSNAASGASGGLAASNGDASASNMTGADSGVFGTGISPSGATNLALGAAGMIPGPIGLLAGVGDFGKGVYYGAQNLTAQPTSGFFTDPSLAQRAGNMVGSLFSPSQHRMSIAQNGASYPGAQSMGTSMSGPLGGYRFNTSALDSGPGQLDLSSLGLSPQDFMANYGAISRIGAKAVNG